MKNLSFLITLLLLSCCMPTFGQIRALINGNYYNDNDNVYLGCSSGNFNVQIQYNYNGNWYAASHSSVDAAPSGWSWTFQPTSNYNKTSIDFNKNYPTSSGQVTITWNAPLIYGATQFHLNMYATPQIYFTSTPAISSSNSSNTYSVYAATSGNVDWTAYGGARVNSSTNYCCGQSATVSSQTYGGLIEVTASNACGTSSAISSVVYTPFIQNTLVNGSNGSSATVSYVASLYLDTRGTATNANWVVTNGSGSLSAYGTSCNAYPNNFLRVVGTATNQYGSGQDWTFYIFKEGYSPYRMAYPNPAKNQITLDFEEAIIAEELLDGINLLDEAGKSWRSFDVTLEKKKEYFKQNKGVSFDIKDIPRGTYYMHIKLNSKVYKERILVE